MIFYYVMLFIISVELLLEHDRRFRFVLHSVAGLLYGSQLLLPTLFLVCICHIGF